MLINMHVYMQMYLSKSICFIYIHTWANFFFFEIINSRLRIHAQKKKKILGKLVYEISFINCLHVAVKFLSEKKKSYP